MISTKTFDFNNINLVPRKCIVESRRECDTSTQIGKFTFKLPVVPANMQCVMDDTLAERLAENGYFYIHHRFDVDVMQFSKHMKSKDLPVSISIGVNEDSYELITKLIGEKLYPDFITIDIAHGHAIKMKRMLQWLRAQFPADYQPFLIAGNVSTAEAVIDLEEWGADAIKSGIGPGCFKSGTRILLANGIYKNIEDMQIGDFVINKDGKPVKVLNVMNMGIRNVIKFRNNLHYDHTYVTNDHKFFIGDMSTSSQKTISSRGIAYLLNQQAKTKPKSSKFKWKMIKDCNWNNTVALFPKNIEWKLPESFTIDLAEYIKRGKYDDEYIYTNGSKTNSVTKFNRFIHSGYDLGYMFGTFLGDGCSRTCVNKKTGCESGNISWFFGLHEKDICTKLITSINNILDIALNYTEKSNICKIDLFNKCVCKLFMECGKRQNKHLPIKYLCTNKDYIRGIYNGLIDSDGSIKHISVDKDDKYIFTFTNTSVQLIELFQWCCINLGISYSSRIHSKGDENKSGFKNLSKNPKFNTSYRVQTHILNRYTKEYLYSNIIESSNEYETCETWDIEVECETHSFIANNMIVHNSACTTYTATGFGSRGIQASVVHECAKARKKALIIADGGIREPGDIAKSIVLGAQLVMVGGMFSGLQDSPGPTVRGTDGQLYKEFWGSASMYQSGKSERIEGTKKHIPLQQQTMLEMMNYITECLQSAVSYAGGKTLNTLKTTDWLLKEK